MQRLTQFYGRARKGDWRGEESSGFLALGAATGRPINLIALSLTANLGLWQCGIGGKGNGRERVGCDSGPGEAATNRTDIEVRPSFLRKKDSEGEEG